MKKFIFGLVLFFSFFVFQSSLVNASTSDFYINDFTADYYLDKDNSGHSTLRTVENITATFPDHDQNHGIERFLPMSYDSHRVSLSLKSVTDVNGNNINYSTRQDVDNLVVRIGNADKYVHGETKYVITYTQKDVTKYFSKEGVDEFYWDTNGTGWAQPFSNVSAKIHIGSSIVDSLNGDMSCYYGLKGSDKRCQISKDGDIITANGKDLKANENITFAIGFKKVTFKERTPSVFDFVSDNIIVIELITLFVLLTSVFLVKIFIDKDAPGRPTIIAEYLPPKGVDVPMASLNFNYRNSWVVATLVDLAVRHNIKMISTEKKSIFSGRKFIIEFVSDKGISRLESDLIHAFFGFSPTPGQQYEINSNKKDMALAQKISDIRTDINTRAKTDGYFIVYPGVHRNMYLIALFMLVQALIMGYVFQKNADDFVIVCILAGVSVFIAFFITISSTPRSAKSSEIRDHLKGLKLYIETAEEDRIKFLQSPEGTLRDSVDISDGVAILHLYERLLPYAILMGIEKKWVKVLSEYYDKYDNSPYWYSGHDTFNSSTFANDLSSFSSSTASSTTYTSSSSGGSSGGGSSGGGGGGGGGGGW